jgi:hypothetical protein
MFRISGIAICLVTLSACATPVWDESTPERCRVATASVTLACTVQWNGSLADCAAVEESAPGCGFTQEALDVAARTRQAPSDTWKAGERVQLTTQFTNAPGPR